MIRREQLEQDLEPVLQRSVKFAIGDKVLKRGKILIYQFKDFHIKFTILNNKGETKYYELPYPFAIEKYDNHVVLDYTLDTLSCGNTMLLYKLKVINRHKKNKLYNSRVEIIDDID